MDQPGKVANPARGQLNRENEYSPVPVRAFSLSMEMRRLTRDRTAEPVSQDQILRHKCGQGNISFHCSAGYVQDWQPYPVNPYSCYMCHHTYIHTYSIVAYTPVQDCFE